MSLTILKCNVETAGDKVCFENKFSYQDGRENTVKLKIIRQV